MIKLLIDGSEVHLAADISLEFYDRNPFFTSEGQHTLDIDISLADPVNAVIYNAMHRIDVTGRPQNRQAILYCEKGVIIKGTEIILEIDERNAKIQIVSGNSEFNFLIGGDRYLRDLDLGDTGVISVEDAKRSLYSQYPDCDYVCTPVVVNPVFRDCGSNVMDDSAKIYNEINPNKDINNVSLVSNTTICPQPYLVAMVHRVAKALGYSITSDAIAANKELSRLIFVHGHKTTQYNKMVENWKVSDFISEVEHLCGVSFIIDNNYKEIVIANLANYYDSVSTEEISARDVIGDINKKFDQDVPDDLVYHNIEYNFPNTDIYKFYALKPDFAKRITYEYCQRQPPQPPYAPSAYYWLYNVWYKIFDGNTAYFKEPDDQRTLPQCVFDSFHSMKAYYETNYFDPSASLFLYIPLEFPFVIRNIYGEVGKNALDVRLCMVDQFGPRVDERYEDKMTLDIVPVEIVFSKYKVNYYNYPMPIAENGDGDVGTIVDADSDKGVAQRIVDGESSEPSAKDNMFVGFYMGVSRFDVNYTERGTDKPAVPTVINSRLLMLIEPRYPWKDNTERASYWQKQNVMYVSASGRFDLSINSTNGMYNTYWKIPQQLDLNTVYVIRFRSLQRRDARHLFNIGGRKFYCQQLKYEVVGGRLSDVIEGTFYPLKG